MQRSGRVNSSRISTRSYLPSAFSSDRPSAEQPTLGPGLGWGRWSEQQLSDMKDCLG